MVSLSSDDLVVVGAEWHAGLGPGVEVSSGIDGTANTLALTNGPVLLEGLGAVDGRCVSTGGLEDVVGGSISGHCAFLGGSARGVVRAKRLDDVVLNQRAASPAIDGKIAIAVGCEGTGVRDGPEDAR